MTLSTSSASIRQLMRSKRKALSASFQQSAAQALLLTLTSDVAIQKANHIALYLASNGELDLHPFIQWCWQHNKQLYLPVVHPFSKGNLLFLHYEPNSAMITNCYGIAEPALDVRAIKPISTIDVLLTPLVAFDNSGARIGMGGGYYDRTLAKWHQHYVNNKYHKPSPIGIAHNCQEVDKISPEAWDIPLPKIVTPTRVIHCCALKTSG